jgi:predicted O-methyltransferase YrrM
MKDPKFFRIFDYDHNMLPNPRLAELEHNVTDIESAKTRSGFSIGYPGWNLLYYLSLCQLNPFDDNVIVETGTNRGCSTIALAQALIDSGRKGTIHSIEIDAENHRIAKDNLARAGVSSRVNLYLGDSKTVLRDLLPTLGPITMAFLDGSHLHDDVLFEFATVEQHLCKNGIVFFDNTYPIADPGDDPRVYGALKSIRDQFGGNFIALDFVSWYTPGIALWQKSSFYDRDY